MFVFQGLPMKTKKRCITVLLFPVLKSKIGLTVTVISQISLSCYRGGTVTNNTTNP